MPDETPKSRSLISLCPNCRLPYRSDEKGGTCPRCAQNEKLGQIMRESLASHERESRFVVAFHAARRPAAIVVSIIVLLAAAIWFPWMCERGSPMPDPEFHRARLEDVESLADGFCLDFGMASDDFGRCRKFLVDNCRNAASWLVVRCLRLNADSFRDALRRR
jgi:hypothetical protein